MHFDLGLFGGLLFVLVLLGAIDFLLARCLGLKLERAVLAVGVIVPLLLLGAWLDSRVVMAPTNLLEGIVPGAPPLEASTTHNILNDAVYQFLPWELEIRRALKTLRLPLWSDALEGGSSPWVNPQAGALSPLAWMARPFEIQHFLLVMLALKLQHALLGTWLLCRRVGVNRRVSLLAAVGFALCGAMSAWAMFAHTTTMSWVPWLTVGVISMLRSRGLQRVVPVAVLTAALLLSGHPEVAAGGGLLAGLSGLALRNRRKPTLKVLGKAALAAILGFGLAAPLLVPFAKHLPKSQRAQEAVSEALQSGGWSLARPDTWFDQEGRTLLRTPTNPHAFGRPYEKQVGDDGRTIVWPEILAGYPGIAALLGAAVVMLGTGRRRATPFFGFFVVALLLAANAKPLVALLDLIPPLRAMAYARLFLPAGLAVWVAAAIGLDCFLRRPTGRWLQFGAASAVAFVVLSIRLDAMVLSLVLLGMLALLVSIRSPRFGVAMLAAMTLLDLVPWVKAQYPTGDPALFYPRTGLIAQLEAEVQSPAMWRAVGEDYGVFPSILPVFGIAEVRPHNPLAPMDQVSALTHAFRFGPTRDVYFSSFVNADHRLIDFLNVRAIVWNSDHPVPARFVRFDDGQTPGYRLFRNPDALPRCFFPTQWTRVGGDALGTWIEGLDDARHVAVSSGSVELPVAAGGDTFEVRDSKPGRIALTSDTRSGALVATSLPSPEGWRASVAGGEQLSPVVVNGAFFGFVVPAGRHDVTLRFVPPGFLEGLWIGAFAALVCAALLIRDRIAWRRAAVRRTR
ncbi:MAG: YfhO family protein [Thermoanaerobaculia bacterium]|nr:YfhO family protein [Thermoanaerobaculia bacterium]